MIGRDESLSDGKICTLDGVDQLCAWLDATRKLDSRDWLKLKIPPSQSPLLNSFVPPCNSQSGTATLIEPQKVNAILPVLRIFFGQNKKIEIQRKWAAYSFNIYKCALPALKTVWIPNFWKLGFNHKACPLCTFANLAANFAKGNINTMNEITLTDLN